MPKNRGVFSKVFLDNDLYDTTEEEMQELENWKGDDSVCQGAKATYRPLFNSIQKEKEAHKKFNGNIIIREVNKKDAPKLKMFSRRVCHTGKSTGIRSFSDDDWRVRLSAGKSFVATTDSGFIVGLSSFLIGEVDNVKCGYELLLMVSRLFQRKGIAEKLFDHTIKWAQENNLTHINSTSFSEEGYEFAQAQCLRRNDIKCVLGRFGTSTFDLNPKE